MKKDNKILKSASVLTGILLTGSLSAFALTNSNTNLLDYQSMGSGSEVRSEITHLNTPNVLNEQGNYKFNELKCGEGKCGEGEKKGKVDTTKKAESKTTEAKCGEGKCGADKKATKTAKESKTSESKCGEGKCG